MNRFMGSHPVRLDAKGRVLIPAAFRPALKNENGCSTLVVLPSDKHRCIDCWPQDGFERMTGEIEPLSRLGEDREDWAAAIFADATLLESDREGRIVLPATLTAQSDITDAMLFMGLGDKFQIWEPAAGEARKRLVRERGAELRRALERAA